MNYIFAFIFTVECVTKLLALGDVYFAEVAVIYLVCANRAKLFELEVGETFVCDMDHDSFDLLTSKFVAAGR